MPKETKGIVQTTVEEHGAYAGSNHRRQGYLFVALPPFGVAYPEKISVPRPRAARNLTPTPTPLKKYEHVRRLLRLRKTERLKGR